MTLASAKVSVAQLASHIQPHARWNDISLAKTNNNGRVYHICRQPRVVSKYQLRDACPYNLAQ